MGTMERDQRLLEVAEDRPAILRALRRADSECRRVDLTYTFGASEYEGHVLNVRTNHKVAVRIVMPLVLRWRKPKVVWVRLGDDSPNVRWTPIWLERVMKVVVHG